MRMAFLIRVKELVSKYFSRLDLEPWNIKKSFIEGTSSVSFTPWKSNVIVFETFLDRDLSTGLLNEYLGFVLPLYSLI